MPNVESLGTNAAQVSDASPAMENPSSAIETRRVCKGIAEVRHPGGRRRLLPVLLLGGAALVAYIAVERLSTRANADRISFSANLTDGFLAVGMSDTEPGFILLSALDRGQVSVSAEQASSVATGTSTTIEIQTPREEWSATLRRPQVIVVSEDGHVAQHAVRWTLADFQAIDYATDCEHPAPSGHHRCGAPFADLYDVAQARQLEAPDDVLAFLKRHGGQ